MIISEGEKIHVITRRRFEQDVRRHFAGTIVASEGAVVRAEGCTFVFNSSRNRFEKKLNKRIGIFDLAAEGYIVNTLPSEVVVENLIYKTTDEGSLVFTDNAGYSLNINEFSVKR
jgi:hypothetical protein